MAISIRQLRGLHFALYTGGTPSCLFIVLLARHWPGTVLDIQYPRLKLDFTDFTTPSRDPIALPLISAAVILPGTTALGELHLTQALLCVLPIPPGISHLGPSSSPPFCFCLLVEHGWVAPINYRFWMPHPPVSAPILSKKIRWPLCLPHFSLEQGPGELWFQA